MLQHEKSSKAHNYLGIYTDKSKTTKVVMTTSNNINKSILGPVAFPMKGTTLKVPYSGISKVSSSVSILNKLHPSKANLDSS